MRSGSPSRSIAPAKLGLTSPWPRDAIAVTSFGDASANHSTAAGAINTACQVAYQGLPMPVLFVCEDNGLGISVRTPAGWIATAYSSRPPMRYFTADGTDLAACFDAALDAATYVRTKRAPAFLHLSVVRFMAHAGTDAEVSYRSAAEITADFARDPLLGTARLLVGAGLLTPGEAVDRYEAMRRRVRALAEEAVTRRGLASGEEIMAPLAPRRPDHVARRAARSGHPGAREDAFGGRLPEAGGPLTLADSINRGLADALVSYPNLLVFGEDVGRKGGVYGVTRGLARRFGAGRVFDSLLDEQSILGLALGAGTSGLLPVPEIQYLAYLHNAEDQLRGEAASLQFFSTGQYRNPMVVRVAGLAYQKGFGGHFHNDNSVAVLRDIPGLIVAVPSRGDDATAMLRTCLAAADTDGSVCVFLEPIALYHTRDLYQPGDDGWLAPYAAPGTVGRRARPDRPRPGLRCWHAADAGDVRQWGPDVAAGGTTAGRPRHQQPRAGSALAVPASRRRPAAGGRRDRTSPGRRRNSPFGWRLRRGHGGPGRFWFHRTRRPGHRHGQLHPARRCGPVRTALRSQHRKGGSGSSHLNLFEKAERPQTPEPEVSRNETG